MRATAAFLWSRSKTDMEAQGAVVVITPAAIEPLFAIRPASVDGREKVFGVSESRIARRVEVIARAAGLENWGFFSGHGAHRHGPGAWPKTALAPTRSSARAVGSGAEAWSAAIPEARVPDPRSGIFDQ